MSQANQTGAGGARETLASLTRPSFEMPSTKATDPDLTPTRWDIDARALDRALAPPAIPDEIEVEDILEVVQVDSNPRGVPSKPARPLRPPIRAALPSIDVVLDEPTSEPPCPLPSFAPVTVEESLPWLAESNFSVAPVRVASIGAVFDEPGSEPLCPLPSFAPVTVEEPLPWLAESTFSVAMPHSRARKGLALAIGIALLTGGIVLGVALRSAGAKVAAQAPPPSPAPDRASVATSQPPSGAANGGAASAAPAFDVTSLPQAPVGTVSLAATASSHRLIVDGVVAPSGSVVVNCGKHLVKVGSKGRSQVVDISCGGETIVGL